MNDKRKNEWAAMNSFDRANASRRLDPLDVAEMYAALPSNPRRGPRVTRTEWAAMGPAAQRALRPHFPAWEAAIVDGWDADPEAFRTTDDPATMGWRSKSFSQMAWAAFLFPPIGLLIGLYGLLDPYKRDQAAKLIIIAAFSFFIVGPLLMRFLTRS